VENRGSVDGVQVWDDYAHHPTEVRAALNTIRTIHRSARIWCVFEPHQAARTRYFLDEFAAALQLADRVAIAEIHRAREGPWRRGDVTAADLAEATRRAGADVLECHKPAEILAFLRLACCQGDVLVTLGAGNIGKFSHAFANRI
jgi:UDP-N-acetylmuramate--alanine ligase